MLDAVLKRLEAEKLTEGRHPTFAHLDGEYNAGIDTCIAAVREEFAKAPAPLDPDMPAQQIRLHMGEMSAQEMRTARAAIRWANSHYQEPNDSPTERTQPCP